MQNYFTFIKNYQP